MYGHTPLVGIAAIVGAQVSIVTVEFSPALAITVDAVVYNRAGIAVRAWGLVRNIHTAGLWVTTIIRARVGIVTRHTILTDACTGAAGRRLGAGIAVITIGSVGRKHAASVRVAGIIRTTVAIHA
jgi:hypothetical protein